MNSRSPLHNLFHLCLLLLLLLVSACTDGSTSGSDNDTPVAISTETVAPASTTPTATSPPTNTPVPTSTPTPVSLAEVVPGNTFEPSDEEASYLYQVQRETIPISLQDVLWHAANEEFFKTHQVRLLETADDEQLVYKLIDPFAKAQIGWHTPTTSPQFEFQMVEDHGTEVRNLAGLHYLEYTNENAFSIPLLSVEETVVDNEPVLPLIVEVWDEERQAYLTRTLLVSDEGEILSGIEADEVYEAKTVVLPVLRESIPEPYVHVRTNGQMEVASHQRDEYNRILFRQDSGLSSYLLSRAEVGLERASEALLHNMAQAREEGLVRFSMIDPNGYEVNIDIVPLEIQQSFEWNWEYRGFYKEEEEKRYVFRTSYIRPENPNAPDAPEYELVQEWVEILDVMDLSQYGYGIWTLEGDSIALMQPWANRPSVYPSFNQERASNVAEGWDYLLQGRDILDVIEVPDHDRLGQWRLSTLGRSTVLDLEEEPETFEEIANIAAGITIEIASRHDDTFEYAVGTVAGEMGWGHKIRVEGGRPILTIYSGSFVSRAGVVNPRAAESGANIVSTGLLWAMSQEYTKPAIIASTAVGGYLLGGAGIKESVFDTAALFMPDYLTDEPTDYFIQLFN